MKRLFLFTAMIFLGSVSAFAENNIDRAIRFVDALEVSDMKTVESFMADDFVFEDPTFGVRHEGHDNVLELYKGYIGDARNMHKYLLESYESTNTVVLRYSYYIEMNVAAKGKPKDYLPVMALGSRVFDFNREGQIVRHIDVADYGAVQKAIAARAAKAK